MGVSHVKTPRCYERIGGKMLTRKRRATTAQSKYRISNTECRSNNCLRDAGSLSVHFVIQSRRVFVSPAGAPRRATVHQPLRFAEAQQSISVPIFPMPGCRRPREAC